MLHRTPLRARALALVLAAASSSGPARAQDPAQRPAPVPAPPATFVRCAPSPGVELLVLVAPEAPAQSLFVCFESGFFDDAPGAVQGAHLAEHLAVRATDPDALVAGTVHVNGETLGASLRLEALGRPTDWPDLVARVPAWLAARVDDPDLVALECGRIAAEVDATAPRGFTAKWALAAWTQVLRHGARHVRVRPDPERFGGGGATLARHVTGVSPVRVVAVGPRSAEDVLGDFRAALAAVGEASPPADPTAPPEGDANSGDAVPPVGPPAPLPTGDVTATWDLPSTHYQEWYALEDDSVESRAVGTLLSAVLTTSLARADVLRPGTFPVVTLERPAPGRRAVWISLTPREGVRPEAVRASVARSVTWAAEAEPATLLRSALLAAPLAAPPDLADLRRRFGDRPGSDGLEAQVALDLVLTELRAGCPPEELRAAVDGLGAEEFARRARAVLRAERRGSLWLQPGQ